jgi:hypothetical protein
VQSYVRTLIWSMPNKTVFASDTECLTKPESKTNEKPTHWHQHTGKNQGG